MKFKQTSRELDVFGEIGSITGGGLIFFQGESIEGAKTGMFVFVGVRALCSLIENGMRRVRAVAPPEGGHGAMAHPREAAL